MSEHFTLTEFFALFGKPAEDTRWIASADSADYLACVTYLMARSNWGRP